NTETGACEEPDTDCTVDGCPDGEECNTETGACEEPDTDCTVDGCPDGEECNTETGACEENTVADGTPCEDCSSGDDCPEGWACTPLASGKACLPPCNSNQDCTTGWTCQGDPKVCTPAGFRCDGCVSDGCDEDEVCNTIDGECSTPRGLCEPCTYGWECGPDAACIKEGPSSRVCMPRCGGEGQTCPASSTCDTDADTGLKVCLSDGDKCCYEADPTACLEPGECNPPCSGETPFCVDDTCVQCLNNTHCTGEMTCDELSGSCKDPNQQCTGDTPFFWDGECVECLNNTHCADGLYCESETHTCTEQGSVCDTCSEDYPACVEVNGEFYCVPCDSDDDCGDNCACNTDTYSCEGDCTVKVGDCQSDADCDPGMTNFTLECDQDTGLCYDTAGQCDGVTAYCRQGKKCLSPFGELGEFFDQFAGAGGGGTIPGSCECDTDAETAAFLAGEPGPVCGSASCFSLGDLLGTGDDTASCMSFDF
ncbi:MAG: hypothetical protein ACQEXJ_12755, partial [Myxococcota bacterium]